MVSPRLSPLGCLLLGAALLASSAGPGAAAAAAAPPAFKVIVHPDNHLDAIDRDDLARLFLKRTTRWTDGTTTLPADQVQGSAVRQGFSQDVLGRSSSAVRAFWQQVIFSGRGVPPPELDSDAAVVAFVLRSPGAIGYVSAAAPVGKARVLHLR